ncbi:MAG: glycoside hydrolase family 3 C-terminal domain-containing protein [Acidobacterium ailaaui]|nr:glycoside hydrolase family 3 C-terminal domain-containing protein [Pseudacidobacterium ailaaui]MCL6463727.1 glycoside hydrolase family 3 C-terminal domain-containing protein [Pseudacidobacterium ailaaui]MDI3254542.1 glycoside hydrolase family 3 C-terminal domain-containing protein [Bacillota bacterium]
MRMLRKYLPVVLLASLPAFTQDRPWMNKGLSPEERADLVLKQMTLDEKIDLLHGNGMAHTGNWQMPLTHLSNGGAGYVVGVPRLGISPLYISDAAYGVRSSGENGRYSTALPSNLGAASSWDPQAACEYGALIGRELRAQGYNMTLGGGVNLTREPRNGRTFEYMGEDPLLAGTMVGNLMKCEQAQHVVGDIKHYAMNDQETGRNIVNAVISKRAMRESDLLAFQIGLRISNAAAVMCSYNRVNGDFSCENKYLLTDVLKHDWNFKGFVLSDWGGTHSTEKASAAGLDQEQPMADYFGPKLKEAVEAGRVPMSEIDDHARRVLWAEFASGVIDDPVQKSVVDAEGGLEIAQHLEEQSIVLLKNEKGVLPLDAAKLHRVAVIGGHADVGMISGGGSAQVDPPGGNAIAPPGQKATTWQAHIWFPTSPLKALRTELPNAKVEYNSGEDPDAAAELAKNSDVAIVFAYQWESEGMDLPNLSLPDNQDALIERVAAANPHTIVVLETGTAVTMPWINQVSGIVEAWYAGSSGHRAVANVLLGKVNPSAKLAMTFPKSEQDLPRPVIAPLSREDFGQGTGAVNGPAHVQSRYSVHYDEGVKVGYKWYEAEHKAPLFPFGFGLSYTSYAYSGIKTDSAQRTVTFTVKNTGKRAGTEIAQVYAVLPEAAGEPFKRLVGWQRVSLQPGEAKTVSVVVDPLMLSIFDEQKDGWELLPGTYAILAGPSSEETPLHGTFEIH